MTRSSLDARVRLSVALAAWAVALAAPHPATAATVALLALGARLGRARPAHSLLPAAAIALLAGGLLAALGTGAAPGAGHWRAAAALAARILAAGWVGAALVAWLPPAELLGALAWLRLPPTLLEVLAVADRQRHAVASHARAILDAQRLRLGWSGLRRALRSTGALAGLAAWRAVSQAEIAADALALRGARGRLRPALEPRPGWRNLALAAGAAAALCACLLLPGLLAP